MQFRRAFIRVLSLFYHTLLSATQTLHPISITYALLYSNKISNQVKSASCFQESIFAYTLMPSLQSIRIWHSSLTQFIIMRPYFVCVCVCNAMRLPQYHISCPSIQHRIRCFLSLLLDCVFADRNARKWRIKRFKSQLCKRLLLSKWLN